MNSMSVLHECGYVMQALAESVDKHGDWSEYTIDQMMEVILDEILEVGEAEARADLLGDHGMIRELRQVAACCIKMSIRLGGAQCR